MIEWLLWLPSKSDFINFNILETLKNSPNGPLSLKFLEQRVHELVGGGSTERCVVKEKSSDKFKDLHKLKYIYCGIYLVCSHGKT